MAVLAGLSACSAEVTTNPNSPNSGIIEKNPTVVNMNAAVQGILSGSRSTAGTYVATLGTLGRESYNLDQAEPRNVLSLLTVDLAPGGFGIDMAWTNAYRNLRAEKTILDNEDKVVGYTAAQKEAVRGFVKTMMALDLLGQIRVRDTLGIAIDVNTDPSGELAPIVSKDAAYARIAQLLDEGKTHLAAGGATFPFQLTTGFAGFSTPATFVRFNRAILARTEVYRRRWQPALDALNESFVSTASGSASALAVGVYHVYSANPGDAINPVYDPLPKVYVAHPSWTADVQKAADGTPDRRLAKAVPGTLLTSQGLSSNLRITLYPSSSSPIPMIRNEELILLRAEANYGLGKRAEAIADLNFIRTNAGGLAALPADYAGDLVTEILYNRRYSLFFEYGHRWVDARRYGRLATIPKDLPGHKVFPYVPLPNSECDQRAAALPPACANVGGV